MPRYRWRRVLRIASLLLIAATAGWDLYQQHWLTAALMLAILAIIGWPGIGRWVERGGT